MLHEVTLIQFAIDIRGVECTLAVIDTGGFITPTFALRAISAPSAPAPSAAVGSDRRRRGQRLPAHRPRPAADAPADNTAAQPAQPSLHRQYLGHLRHEPKRLFVSRNTLHNT
eukprot:4619519-Pyramimonas_sp.AAC.1